MQKYVIDGDLSQTHEDYKLDEMLLYFCSIHLTDKNKTLSDYGINGSPSSLSTRPMSTDFNSTTKICGRRLLNHSVNIEGSLNFYDLSLVLIKKSKTGKFNIGLDFTFNIVNDVKKVDWSNNAPDYREITDGL